MADSFGDRMKGYERAAENILPRRLPVIVRIDGNSFSKLTADLDKPFDRDFEEAMNAAAIAVCSYCSGAQLAYVQSDEITVLLRNDQNRDTDPFLGNRTQKLASLVAGTATLAFNKHWEVLGRSKRGIFDCRAFVVPPSEVVNVFLWRQQDAFRNFVHSYAYWRMAEKYGKKTAQKLLHGNTVSVMQEIIFQEFGVNVNDLRGKRGRTVERREREGYVRVGKVDRPSCFDLQTSEGLVVGPVVRKGWEVIEDIPLFNQDRGYIEKFLGGGDVGTEG